MNVTGDDVVRVARSWKGTPFHHQASVKGVGCDCYGLVRGVARELGLIPDHVPITTYPPSPDGTMDRLIGEVLIRIPHSVMKAGDIATFAWSRQIQHMGILTGHGTIIHGYGSNQRGCVVETPLGGAHARRLRGVFRFPELVYG